MHELSILSGRPPAGPPVPVSQPTLPRFEDYVEPLAEVFASHQITNDKWVRRLEESAAAYLGCSDVVALGNATSGLILTAKLLGLEGEVCLPTFTFPATLHALLWNGLRPRLVDSDPETFNLDPASVASGLAHGARCIVPVYIFGNSPDWDRLGPEIRSRGVACYSDAAHALGTRWDGTMAGNFGDAEIFSLAPTKVTVAGEGGLVATNRPEFARELRVARNYGNPGDYDCVLAGLNARQSELHALLAFLSLRSVEESIARRNALAARYREGLEGLDGIRFQRIDPRCRTTWNYFAIRIASASFGLSNRHVQAVLAAEGIQSKIYFAPPLHRQTKFTALFEGQGPFPGAERILDEVLCLPLYTHMADDTVDRVCEAVRSACTQAERIRNALTARAPLQEAGSERPRRNPA